MSFLVSFTISYTPVLKKILTMQLYFASVALHRSLPWEFGQFAWESVLHPQKVDVELSKNEFLLMILLLDYKMPCSYRKYRYLRRHNILQNATKCATLPMYTSFQLKWLQNSQSLGENLKWCLFG